MTLDTAELADVSTSVSSGSITGNRGDSRGGVFTAELLKFYRPVQTIVWITAMLIAMGGLFGGLNTMYAAFAARSRELGTLQALGFSRAALIVSLVQESLLACTCRALLAAALGVLLLDGFAVSAFQAGRVWHEAGRPSPGHWARFWSSAGACRCAAAGMAVYARVGGGIA